MKHVDLQLISCRRSFPPWPRGESMRPANFRPTFVNLSNTHALCRHFPSPYQHISKRNSTQISPFNYLGTRFVTYEFWMDLIVFLRNKDTKYPRLMFGETSTERYVYIDCFATFFVRTMLILCTAVVYIFVHIWKEMSYYKRQTFQLLVCYSFNHIIRKCLILWTRTSKCSCQFQRHLT